MTSFLSFIFHTLFDSIPFILTAVVSALLILVINFLYKKKKYGQNAKISWLKSILTIIFFAYIGMLVAATLAGRTASYAQYANFHLFRAWRDAWNNFSQQSWLNVILNVAMFMPLGLILPFLSEKFKTWYWPLIAGFLISSVIEAIQYFTGIGLMDVDDIFCNTLGALLGGCTALAFSSLFTSAALKWRRFISYLSVPLIFILTVAGIFGSYHLKEYGNILEAPGYRQKVRNADWKLSCELSDETYTVPIYSSPRLSKEDADSFAEEFAHLHGFKINSQNYSDFSSNYSDSDSGASIYINFSDGSYIYEKSAGYNDFDKTDYSELEARAALEAFGVRIPQGSVFYRDDQGHYIFEADRLSTSDDLYIGMVSFILNSRCEIEELYNYMVKCTVCGYSSVVSEQKAYDKLKRGDFSGPEWFPGDEPDNYEITGCELKYSLDSKGFYRPVYVFTALVDGYNVGNGFLVLAD